MMSKSLYALVTVGGDHHEIGGLAPEDVVLHIVQHRVGERDGADLLDGRPDVDGREHVEGRRGLKPGDLDVAAATRDRAAQRWRWW